MSIARTGFLMLVLAPGILSAQSAISKTTKGSVISLGKTSFQNPIGATTPTPALAAAPKQIINEPALIRRMHASTANAAMANSAGIPRSSKNASVGYGGSVFTVPGLDNSDNRSVNGGDLEPPDQGLCAGGGQILETINLVLAVYDEKGNKISNDVSANAFFGVGPNFFTGDSLSDPRCYYDQTSQHWFVTLTDIADVGYIPGGFGRSFILIAVSDGPSVFGNFNLYAIDTTDDGLDGTPANHGCLQTQFGGCFGDQPLLGADEYGFYT